MWLNLFLELTLVEVERLLSKRVLLRLLVGLVVELEDGLLEAGIHSHQLCRLVGWGFRRELCRQIDLERTGNGKCVVLLRIGSN